LKTGLAVHHPFLALTVLMPYEFNSSGIFFQDVRVLRADAAVRGDSGDSKRRHPLVICNEKSSRCLRAALKGNGARLGAQKREVFEAAAY
jgi:hypothetical protein